MPIRGMQDKREFDKEKLKELAFLDDLTSLYNRRYLYRYLPTELEDMRAVGKKLCLFMMDVDNFKEINDTYGHLCGDKALVEIAEVLRKSLRREDTVIRYAGDEFMAILPGTEEEIAARIAQRIVDTMNKKLFQESADKPKFHVTISIGLALFPDDAQVAEKLIHQADRALYSSKRSGRNRLCSAKDVTTEVLDETRIQEVFLTPQLFGREQPLDRLKGLLDEAAKGQSKFILIKGERGIGKTRLLEELKKTAQLKGITEISASCLPEISAQPYQILISALENLFSSLGPQVREFIRSLPEAQTAQLANYIPALQGFLPENLKKLQTSLSEQGQVDLFKGICQSLIYVVKRNTLVLIIDDFHWMDKETLQLFNYIIKELHNIPILIIAAYRQEELKNRSADTSLQELLLKMQQDKLVDELTLEPLEKKDVQEFIETVFAGINVSAQFVDVVYDVSAGNPLFTEELLRSLAKKGFIFYQDGKWHSREITEATLSPFLKEAVQKRFIELDEETRPIVSAAAVIGEIFDFDILCQLLDKDPGYILEVIDRAARQHLIMQESPFQTDKFKFNSGVIRDVIYGSINPREKQELHRRLALIEEKAYKNRIDSVAGTLGYHFAKAQDKEKTALYSQMLLEKAKHMPAYEDVFGFLQDAFLEKVEEIVVPLSDASIKLVPAMVRSMRLAVQNVRLYPGHSAVRKTFVNQAYKSLTDILNKDSSLIISTAENRLLINGEEISEKARRESAADAFIAIMIDYRIKSINFKQDLTEGELNIFLEGLSQDYDELIEQGGLSGMLRKNEVTHIKVNEIRYEQTSKLAKQRTQFEEAMLIDYLIGRSSDSPGGRNQIAFQMAGDPKKLSGALTKIAEETKAKDDQDKTEVQVNSVFKSLQRLMGQVTKYAKGEEGQYRKNIVQAIMALDEGLRGKMVQTQLKSGNPIFRDIINDTVRLFPDEEILKTVTQEFAESKGDLADIRHLIGRLLLDPQRKQRLLPQLKTKLAELGITKEETAWVLGKTLWQDLSLDEKIKQLLELPADKYIKLEISKQIGDLVSEVLKNNQDNQARAIIDKLLRQLEEKSAEVRGITLKDLAKISERLIFKEKFFLLQQITSTLIGKLNQEKDAGVYAVLAQVLSAICASLIKKQNFMQAAEILKEMNLRLDKKSNLPEIQKKAIAEAKTKTVATNSLIEWLTKLLAAKIESDHAVYEISQVIAGIGPPAIEAILTLGVSQDLYIDPFRAYALRWSIAKVLRNMGEEAVLCLQERLAEKEPELIKATLEIFRHMQNKDVVKHLSPLLKHQDLNVRKDTIITLGKIGGSEAMKMLSETIKDKDSQIRLAAIRALANIGTKEVLPLLKPLMKEAEFAEELKRIIWRIEEK